MPHVTFRSSQFSSTPAPDAINAMLGKDLAQWLRNQLAAAGFETGDVIAEDYGYGFWLTLHDAHYWISHAQYEPSEMDKAPVWSVSMDNDPGCLWMWRLRQRPQPGDLLVIARAMQDCLTANPHVSEVQWWMPDGSSSPAPPPN